MAGSIAYIAKATFVIDGMTFAPTGGTTKTIAMASTAQEAVHTNQYIGTSREALAIGDIDITNATGDEYVVSLWNRHATAVITVEIQTDAAVWVVDGIMRPGEPFGPVRKPKLGAGGYGGLFLTSTVAGAPVEKSIGEAGDPAA